MPRRAAISRNGDVEAILKEVEKPGRYIGGEWNEIKKDPSRVEAKIALIFPDVYEIGMSYLGQKILYSVLNSFPSLLAERVFAPWPDLEQKLRERRQSLFSLENKIPLREFDILGFSLLYELNYSNILTILDLGRIPFYSGDRKRDDPLVIAGGPAAFNPEPLSDIFDAFLIGDGEEAFPEIADKVISLRKKKAKRDEILGALADVQGVYVPSLYSAYEPRGSSLLARRPGRDAPARILKRVVSSLKRFGFPENIVVPDIQTVFDRVAVEVARGCPQKCRFCQAASIYSPFRALSPVSALAKSCRSLRLTGYEDVSLSALSIADFPFLEETVDALMEELVAAKISLSLSSLRPKGLSSSLAENILRVRKTGFTLVPEAGTDRLRRVINKNLSNQDILAAAENAFQRGWPLLKLYFMIGLPTEKETDLEGIVGLVEEITRLGREILKRTPRLNLSLSSFIPKPHTPFQWLAMEEEESLREKQRFVRVRLRRMRSVKLKAHPLENSLLEAVFSRGDRRLGAVLIEAWKRGARFDGWKDWFDFSRWQAAFASEGMDSRAYLRSLDEKTVLPWNHIDSGVKVSFLHREWKRALREEPTASCLDADCDQCMGCVFPLKPRKKVFSARPSRPFRWPSFGKRTEKTIRYEVVYSKTGRARFLSHLDVATHLQRAMRRAGIATRFSEGFHPKMLISYAPALPLGMEGEAECFEFKSSFVFDEKAFVSRVNAFTGSGIRILQIRKLTEEDPPLNSRISRIVYSLDLTSPDVKEALAHRRKEKDSSHREAVEFLEAEMAAFVSSRRATEVEFTVDRKKKKLFLCLPGSPRGGLRPQDIITSVLGLVRPVYAMTREKFIFAEDERSERN
ncbi:MAG: TIGR03960 family B12-binding radical SAM protein [Clostridiales bacterium]|nr:TIGR03960 family B12-binding radical SAM protein [Clostridiales bacterium]